MFTLHPRLAEDCELVADLILSRVLLAKDANYPWLILVPRRADVREIYELEEEDQRQLLRESSTISRMLMDLFDGDKMNVAALGNMVPQLHLHHIVRYQNDAAWPGPIWGVVAQKDYEDDQLDSRLELLRREISLLDLS